MDTKFEKAEHVILGQLKHKFTPQTIRIAMDAVTSEGKRPEFMYSVPGTWSVSKKRLQYCIDSLRNSNQRLEMELLAATSRLANLEDEHDDLSNKHVKLMENMSVPRR